jgi:hypothetical protein
VKFAHRNQPKAPTHQLFEPLDCPDLGVLLRFAFFIVHTAMAYTTPSRDQLMWLLQLTPLPPKIQLGVPEGKGFRRALTKTGEEKKRRTVEEFYLSHGREAMRNAL